MSPGCPGRSRTRRIMIGPMVTPLARRRPQVVARQLVALDHLSAGRVVLGAGLGLDSSGGELSRFGEETDDRRRAGMLDEALELLTGLLAGGRSTTTADTSPRRTSASSRDRSTAPSPSGSPPGGRTGARCAGRRGTTASSSSMSSRRSCGWRSGSWKRSVRPIGAHTRWWCRRLRTRIRDRGRTRAQPGGSPPSTHSPSRRRRYGG